MSSPTAKQADDDFMALLCPPAGELSKRRPEFTGSKRFLATIVALNRQRHLAIIRSRRSVARLCLPLMPRCDGRQALLAGT
jgi:hypothetical protein